MEPVGTLERPDTINIGNPPMFTVIAHIPDPVSERRRSLCGIALAQPPIDAPDDAEHCVVCDSIWHGHDL
jgi:hypothetical protein